MYNRSYPQSSLDTLDCTNNMLFDNPTINLVNPKKTPTLHHRISDYLALPQDVSFFALTHYANGLALA